MAIAIILKYPLKFQTMKKIKLIPFVLLILLSACNEKSQDNDDSIGDEPLTGEEINRKIYAIAEQTGQFNWQDADDFMLYSAVVRGDSILTVGYGQNAYASLKSTEDANAKEEIIGLVRNLEKSASGNLKSDEDILVYEDEVLNFIDVRVSNLQTIIELRKTENIRYLNPAGYNFFAYESRLKSSSGCTTTPDDVNENDYRTIAPNCLVSWTYDKHNIPAAWTYSTGEGITVGLIDTGVSSEQSLLGSNFNDGYSSGRTISKYGTYVNSIWPWSTSTDGPNDQCGHGTSMAATIASPRNDDNLPVGVAYNCNLVAYRATSDVVLEGYHEQQGVAKALTALANNNDVKIISMSIGYIYSIGKIEDAIEYAYSKDKMMIAAGGTSTSFTNWVGIIFPASMDETIAVTGITDGTGYTECAVCHKGSKIDFTVIMERENDDSRHSVCLGFYDNTKTYVGGSSVATSTTAGIAALIWARHPSWTRDQVLSKMKESSDLYPDKDDDFGYGSIDVLAAVQ
jgi:serine protease